MERVRSGGGGGGGERAIKNVQQLQSIVFIKWLTILGTMQYNIIISRKLCLILKSISLPNVLNYIYRYFLWDSLVSLYYVRDFGVGFVVHGASCFGVFLFAYVSES